MDEPPVPDGNIGSERKPIPQAHGGAILTPYRPGQSGNPNGRPKVARPISVAYAELLGTPGTTPTAQVAEYKRRRGTALCPSDSIAIGMYLAASKGTNAGVRAATEITDRTEGKVPQAHEVSGLDAGPLTIAVKWPQQGDE